MSSDEIPLTPRESGKFISEHTDCISLQQAGIEKLASVIKEEIVSGALSTSNFSQTAIHPTSEDEWAIDWLFVVDTLNFCFWSREDEPGWMVEGNTGYFALCAAINRTITERGKQILQADYYATIDADTLAHILRSDNSVPIPLFDERLRCLQQVGKVLVKDFGGSFKNVVKLADKSAVKLLALIVKHFECFRDDAMYQGKRVALYKRAQILVADIWACYRAKEYGEFVDIDEITMFADYRVPQSLLDYGVFSYNDALLARLQSKEIFPNGDPMEVAIRGCSISAVELVRDCANALLPEGGPKANAILIDHFLWDYRRKHAKEILKKALPFHKTYCIFY